MKLRIKGDSIRIRLTQVEVRELIDQGRIAEATHFPAGPALRYELRTEAAAVAIEARFAPGAVVVTLPKGAANGWADSEEVALQAEIPLGDGRGALLILVEKDFPCLTKRPGEDDSDAFPRTGLSVRC